MVQLTKIYTRGGDRGKTSLANSSRVAKTDPRVELFGAIDESNATLGLARQQAKKDKLHEMESEIAALQNDLFDLGADIARPYSSSEKKVEVLRIDSSQVTRLETLIDRLNQKLAPLNSFVLPGGSFLAGYLHLARTQVRRAERRAWSLSSEDTKLNPTGLAFLNRLSDVLFVLARLANNEGKEDVLWSPAKHQAQSGKTD